MEDAAPVRSVIVLSLNGATTRAVVTDHVEGEPRLLASSSVVGCSVLAALEAIEQRLGRSLLESGRPISTRSVIGDGADAWISVGLPVLQPTVVLVVLGGENVAAELAVSAARASPVRVSRLVVEETTSPTVLAQKLNEQRPDLLLLAGMADDSTWLTTFAAVTSAIDDDWRPCLGIVVAPETIQQHVAATLGEQLELMGVDPGEYAPAEVVRALAAELRARAVEALRSELGDTFSERLVDRVTALERAAAFLVRRADQRLVLVDLEQGATVLWARAEGIATSYRAEQDLGHRALGLAELNFEHVLQWLPWSVSDDELLDWLANRVLSPYPVILKERDQFLAAAFIRALLREVTGEIEQQDVREDVTLIALGPWFATLPPALAVLCALDGIEPVPASGLVSIALDEADLLAAGGAIAELYPGYAARVLERDALLPLAHALILTGDSIEGAVAVRGELRTGEIVQRFSVPWGSVHVLPVSSGTFAELSLEPESGVRIGGLEAGVALQFTNDAALGWAYLGIVIDARGRPLRLPDDPTARLRRLRSWLADLGLWSGGAG